MILSRPALVITAVFAAAGALIAQTQSLQPAAAAPAVVPPWPSIVEGGGVSIEPLYWLTSSQPLLRPGSKSTAETPATLDYPGRARFSPGIAAAFPTGKGNTLRISYFRTQGGGHSNAASDLTLFSTGYTAGDYLSTRYKLQNVKLSWDYLSYTWASNLRLKTLWEAQFTSFDTLVEAPLKDVTTNSDGTVNDNTATGKKWLVYPTFGVGLEHAPSRWFRWEAKASGFGVPRYGSIWDAEASVALRLHRMELLFGEKAFSVKTSPRSEAYFSQRLSGAYVGVRWYLDRMW